MIDQSSGESGASGDVGGDKTGDKAGAPGDGLAKSVGSVLFACTYNAIRSPMAQGLLDRLARGRIYSRSVGVSSELEVDGFAVAAMEEIGIDLARHNPHTFEDMESWGEDIDAFDVIVALSPAAQRHALEYTRHFSVDVEYWPTVDPTAVDGGREQRLEAYRAVRDMLETRIRTRFGAHPSPVV